jgi:hypothetical protein
MSEKPRFTSNLFSHGIVIRTGTVHLSHHWGLKFNWLYSCIVIFEELSIFWSEDNENEENSRGISDPFLGHRTGRPSDLSIQ